MQREEIRATFDRMAPSYDQQWIKLAPIRDALHLLIGATFAGLPAQARILFVGTGTGAEIIYLATKFPHWTFTAVDPSESMIEVCRARLAEHGIENRCIFHADYLETLSAPDLYDAATALLVSQFILDRDARANFFKAIAERLKPGGILVSSDLSADTASTAYQSLLEAWLQVMKVADISDEGLTRMRAAYERDVAILPEQTVADMITAGGFATPIHFFQTGLIHAWSSARLTD